MDNMAKNKECAYRVFAHRCSVKMLPPITMMSLCLEMHGINAANDDGEMTGEEPE